MKKRILVITPNPLHNGPRLIREIDALKNNFEIIAVGSTPPHDETIKYIPFTSIDFGLIDKVIRKLYRLIFNKPYLRNLPIAQKRITHLLDDLNPDMVIIHNPIQLPYVFSYTKKKIHVVYNAHEYHPLEFEDDVYWMKTLGIMYHYIYTTYLKRCDLIINVCDGIAQKCMEQFGVQSLVVPNAASFYTGSFAEKDEQLPMRFVHHGGTNPDRKIEVMIRAFSKLGNKFQLDLMLVNSKDEYFTFLKQEVAQAENVRIINPVSFNNIVPFLTQYHAGVYILPPISFNNKYALPNKFFEFIQARLPIICGPSIEMKKIVEQYKLGVITTNFTTESLIEAISNISFGQLKVFSKNADIAAVALSAEAYQLKFQNAVKKIIN